MKIGVPGEFHEDRWQRTGEDSERRVISHTGSGPIGYKLSRGEAFFRSVFVTATMPTSTPVASSRSEGVTYRVFGTATLPTSISVASPRGERPADRSMTGN